LRGQHSTKVAQHRLRAVEAAAGELGVQPAVRLARFARNDSTVLATKRVGAERPRIPDSPDAGQDAPRRPADLPAEQRTVMAAENLHVGMATLEDERQPSFDAAKAVSQAQQHQW
jgi:hypothetical protein